jgi:hypothetical protein
LIIRRGSDEAPAKRLELAEHARAVRRQAAARTSTESITGSPSPRQIRFWATLSMPSAEASTPAPV